MRRRRKHALQIMLMLFSLIVLVFVAGMAYMEFKPMVVKAVTMEAGTPMVDVKEFLLEQDKSGSFITDINRLDLNNPGSYEILIKVRNRIHTSTLEVVDTTPPVAATVNVMALKGEEVRAASFVTDVKDATNVRLTFAKEPDTTVPGEQKVSVVLEDAGNNRAVVEAMLTILDVKNSVQVEAGSVMNITPSDFVDNDNYKVTILSDLSKLDISNPAVHEIQIDVDGRLLTSRIEVVDTTPPSGQAVDQETWKDERLDAISFIRDIKDISSVKLAYLDTPDFSTLGTREVTIIMEDAYGNKSEQKAKLTVKEDTEPPVFSGIKNRSVYEGESISYKKGVSVSDNRDTDVTFQVDSSNVKLNKPGSYKVYYTATDSSGNKTTESATITVNIFNVTDDMLYGKVDNILDDIIDVSMTQREQAWEIYQWVKGHISYIGSSDKSDWKKEAYRGIENGVGDCFTYYAVSEALLTRAGIENMRVTRVGGRTQHFWNLINCGDGWYHFDTCPHKDKLMSFMLTDAEVEAYTKKRGNNYYTFDKSLYPATPLE